MGLRVGDVIVRLNDQPIGPLSHGQAHEALSLAGNNFVLGVHRVEDTETLVEALTKDNVEPYTISLQDLPPLQPLEEILTQFTAEPPIEEEKQEEIIEEDFEEKIEIIEEIPEKPKDADSEEVPNQNLTDEEIAQLILEEEELLSDKGVLGVNFKKLRPRAPLFKESKVFEELQKEATAEPPQVQELKRTTTFLQKPERPVPKPKSARGEETTTAESQETYRVIIKKQSKKSITERLLEKGLLEPGCVKSPEPRSEKTTPAATPDPCGRSDYGTDSRPESKAEVVDSEAVEAEDQEQAEITEAVAEEQEARVEEPAKEEEESIKIKEDLAEPKLPSLPQLDEQKLKELVKTEISLEKQLESVQKQLLALKQLPSEIENHLRIVSEQLYKIMEMSGVRNGNDGNCCRCSRDEEAEEREEEIRKQQKSELECHCVREDFGPGENQQRLSESDGRRSQASENEGISQIIEPDDGEEPDNGEIEISVKSNEEDDNRVKKYVVSYESKVESLTRENIRSREPSPTPSQCTGSNLGSFEPDPNVDPKTQLIEELKHRQGRKRSQDLWPQAKQLELTYGRRWRCPNDFFNDDMIAEVLSSQAEVIRGRTLGVNFKKFEKTALPNFDHLMNSSVYKMLHKMEQEPKKGIPVRPPRVNAAEDILERVNSPMLSMADDRSCRSVSH
ncbi:titin-like isoform X2 [Belonocnema kinseyi]|nr:titin-like isoform X2 [Belonocnema kinseyi]